LLYRWEIGCDQSAARCRAKGFVVERYGKFGVQYGSYTGLPRTRRATVSVEGGPESIVAERVEGHADVTAVAPSRRNDWPEVLEA
jgi:hypothetical protein